MSKASCPYVVRIDANHRQCAPIDYPSFENNCLAMEDQSSLLLADQATFCLSGSFHYCQRYQIRAAEELPLYADDDHNDYGGDYSDRERGNTAFVSQMSTSGRRDEFHYQYEGPSHPTDNIGGVTSGETLFDEEFLPTEEQSALAAPWQGVVGRWYAWIAAGLLFFAVIAVGGVFAAYTGWQLAVDQLATARAGQVNTLASGAVQQLPPLYVVMTVTPEPVADTGNQSAEVAVAPRTGLDAKASSTSITEQNGFPAAVTATPVILVPLPTATGGQGNAVEQANPPALVVPDQPANIQLPPAESTPTPVPIINVQVAVPTRRSTPEFDIPTSTPEALEPTATATATAVPIVGTPIIVFAADEGAIPPGECTHVRWHVENVRAVYYENLAAFGDGSKEECLRDEADSYALTVIFGDGQTKIYTTTVGILWPTATPSVTPSFTPEILPTETWTPEPPPATPTPDIIYGTTFSINGDNPYRCNAGSQCNIGVLATNVGDSIDTLAIEIVSAGSWQALLCSQIGTCSGQRLVIANVGPGNTLFATLQLTIPADSVGQTTTYALRSVSDGSQGAVSSQVIELIIESSE